MAVNETPDRFNAQASIAAPNPHRVFAVGDSIASGLPVSQENNLTKVGANLDEIISRTQPNIFQEGDTVIISAGGLNGLPDSGPASTQKFIEEYQAKLKKFVTDIQGTGAQVVLLGPSAGNYPDRSAAWQNDVNGPLNEATDEVAQKTNANLVDTSEMSGYYASDDLHFTQAGYDALFTASLGTFSPEFAKEAGRVAKAQNLKSRTTPIPNTRSRRVNAASVFQMDQQFLAAFIGLIGNFFGGEFAESLQGLFGLPTIGQRSGYSSTQGGNYTSPINLTGHITYEGPTLINPDLLAKVQSDTTTAKYFEYAMRQAEANGLDGALFVNQIYAESGFRSGVVSSAGARGIAQFMPATGRAYGLATHSDAMNPYKSLEAAARHMRDLTNKCGGDQRLALAGYNGGMGAVNYVAKNISGPVTSQNWMGFMQQQRELLGRGSSNLWRAQTFEYVLKIDSAYWDQSKLSRATTANKAFFAKHNTPDKEQTFAQRAYDKAVTANEQEYPKKLAKINKALYDAPAPEPTINA